MKKRIVLICGLFCFSFLMAQEFQGVATYQSFLKTDLKMNDSKMSDDIKNEITEQLRKQSQKEFSLVFTKEESIYKENKRLKKLTKPSNYSITIDIVESNEVLYKNLKTNRYIKATDIQDKLFLIKDTLKSQKWKLVNETKKIGNYNCYKATFKENYETATITEAGKIEHVTKEREVVAWYTPEIPTANGPKNYNGLPGLILEVKDGDYTLLCSKLVINPKEKIEIKIPKKGYERFNSGRKGQTVIFQSRG
jgi:GLPGLI family protein